MPISTAKLYDSGHPVPGFAHNASISKIVTITILSGQSLSSPIDLRNPDLFGFTPMVFITPSAWDAAKVSAQISVDGVNWFNFHLWNSDFESAHTLLASEAHMITDYPFRGIPYVRFRSGTDNAPVNQTANRTITVICGTT